MTSKLFYYILDSSNYGKHSSKLTSGIYKAEFVKLIQLDNWLERLKLVLFINNKEQISPRYSYHKKSPILIPIAIIHRIFLFVFRKDLLFKEKYLLIKLFFSNESNNLESKWMKELWEK